MNKFLSRANTKISVSTAAAILATSYFISSTLGLFIRRLLSAKFGVNTGVLDPYWAAFSLPDLTYTLLVAGAIAVVLVPLISDKLENSRRQEAWELSSNVLSFLGIATFVVGILLFVFASPLFWIVAPGLSPEQHEVGVNLMRMFTLNPLLFGISSAFAGMQQAFGRFFFYAVAPVIYNISIITGIVLFAPYFGLYGVALGVVIGAFLQMLVQMLGLHGLGFKYRFKIDWHSGDFKKFLKLLGPRSVDQGAEQLIYVIEKAIATTVVVGVIAGQKVTGVTFYEYAFSLKNVPITLIGAAIATASFPEISRRAASRRTDLFKKEVMDMVQLMLWFAVPAGVTAFLLRGYLVRLLVGSGNELIGTILGWFAFAIVFQSVLQIAARSFYARQNTIVPLYTGVTAVILNVIISLILVKYYGTPGLAMAQSFIAFFEVTLLFTVLRFQVGQLFTKEFIVGVFKTLVATGAMAIGMYLLVRYAFPLYKGDVGFFSLAPKFGVIILISGCLYIAASYMFKIQQAKSFINGIKRLLFKRLKVEV